MIMSVSAAQIFDSRPPFGVRYAEAEIRGQRDAFTSLIAETAKLCRDWQAAFHTGSCGPHHPTLLDVLDLFLQWAELVPFLIDPRPSEWTSAHSDARGAVKHALWNLLDSHLSQVQDWRGDLVNILNDLEGHLDGTGVNFTQDVLARLLHRAQVDYVGEFVEVRGSIYADYAALEKGFILRGVLLGRYRHLWDSFIDDEPITELLPSGFQRKLLRAWRSAQRSRSLPAAWLLSGLPM